jgi:NADH:ubiquinone oxidoreductase subunit C
MAEAQSKPVETIEKIRYGSEFKDSKELLARVADFLKRPGFTHVGSASLHIYKSDTEPECSFQVLTNLASIPEEITIRAVRSFTAAIMESYGHERPQPKTK